MSRRRLIVANWKMNQSMEKVRAFARDLRRPPGSESVDVWLAPAFVHVPVALEALGDRDVLVAGQNCHEREKGAFTGEVSAAMLHDAGARAVIVGHSERRSLCGEDDARVGAKVTAAARAGLTPILCVGETLEQREGGETLGLVTRQLEAGVAGLAEGPLAPGGLVVAYEPVWAIGTGRAASPEDAQQVAVHLRGFLSKTLGDAWGAATRLLYGGSMDPGNVAAFVAQPDVDGGLVGGASLDLERFTALIAAAA